MIYPGDNECALLGSCLLDAGHIDDAAEILQPEHVSFRHRPIWQALLRLRDQKAPVDLVTLGTELETSGHLQSIGGHGYLAELLNFAPGGKVGYHAQAIRNAAVVRRLAGIGQEILQRADDVGCDPQELKAWAEQQIFSLGSTAAGGPQGSTAVLKEIFKDMEWAAANPNAIPGLETGFRRLDMYLGGLQDSDLVILAGRPSMGKTAIAMNIIEHISLRLNKPSLVFSLEMSRKQLIQRMLCSQARVNAARARIGRLKPDEYQRLTEATIDINSSRMDVDDTPALNISEMRARARKHKRQHGTAIVVVDYLQLATATAESRTQEVSELSRQLKAMAKELNVPVLALSQLNRTNETRKDKRPMMSDLRESGQIEQDADVIMFVHRDVVYDPDADKEKAEVIIAKQRNGPIGTCELKFLGDYTRFEDKE